MVKAASAGGLCGRVCVWRSSSVGRVPTLANLFCFSAGLTEAQAKLKTRPPSLPLYSLPPTLFPLAPKSSWLSLRLVRPRPSPISPPSYLPPNSSAQLGSARLGSAQLVSAKLGSHSSSPLSAAAPAAASGLSGPSEPSGGVVTLTRSVLLPAVASPSAVALALAVALAVELVCGSRGVGGGGGFVGGCG